MPFTVDYVLKAKLKNVRGTQTGHLLTVPTGSLVEPYRKEIEAAMAKGLAAQRIWQDLREDYGTGFSYYSVKCLIHELKKRRPEVADVMEHPPGKEAQVDFFEGPTYFGSINREMASSLDIPHDALLLPPRL